MSILTPLIKFANRHRRPQMVVVLDKDGTIHGELPGANGSRRLVEIHSLDSIKRILQAEELSIPRVIGNASAPTAAQIHHWEEHEMQGKIDTRCPFCRSTRPPKAVRRLPAKSKKISKTEYISDGSSPSDYGM